MDFRQRATGKIDGQDRLPGRQYPDWQGVVGGAARGGGLRGSRGGVRRRRHGGGSRRALRQGGGTRPAQGAGFHVSGGPRRRRRAGVPRDRASDRRRVVPVRSRRRGAIARAVARRGGLCRRWTRGVAADVEDRERRGQAAWADEVKARFSLRPFFRRARTIMGCGRLRVAPYLISPASLGSVRLISGMQMMSSSPANSASIYGT